jgi:hypothetical protein
MPAVSSAIARFVRELEAMTAWAQRDARCAKEQQRHHLAGIFTSAKNELWRRQST